MPKLTLNEFQERANKILARMTERTDEMSAKNDLNPTLMQATREEERNIALEQVAELRMTIQNALSELKSGDVQSAIDQLEAGNE